MNDLKGIIEDCNKSDLISDKVIKKIIEIIGQEEWNDLYDEHSNICTTMGELIITLKGIAELEKENKELKTVKIPQLERRIASIRGCHSADAKKLNAKIEQVERLKQENAEIRKRNGELAGQKANLERWLGEAKEIIGKLCGAVRTLNNPNTQLADVDDFLMEAEKFIKECELCM